MKLYPLPKHLYKINRKKNWKRFVFFSFQISVAENQKKSSGSESRLKLDRRGEQSDVIYKKANAFKLHCCH